MKKRILMIALAIMFFCTPATVTADSLTYTKDLEDTNMNTPFAYIAHLGDNEFPDYSYSFELNPGDISSAELSLTHLSVFTESEDRWFLTSGNEFIGFLTKVEEDDVEGWETDTFDLSDNIIANMIGDSSLQIDVWNESIIDEVVVLLADYSILTTETGAGANPVPEPSTMFLIGSGLMFMAFLRRKKFHLLPNKP